MDNEVDITANKYAQVSFMGNQDLTDAGEEYKRIAIGSPAFQIQLFGFSFSGNKLIYQGENKTCRAFLLALVCHEGDQVERELRVSIFKNGVPATESFGKVISTGSNVFKAVSFETEISLSSGDEIEAVIYNSNGMEKVRVKDFKLAITSK
ncbi:MAG TPA: hypothetical protein VNW99_08540 [Cytophagaceae bacterium]|jgi:hypothetical protein|nr:hypothetical protein [Cytophagaceae bacterium]